MTHEAQICNEKAQKSMVDAARLADELRQEQAMALGRERDRKLLECQVKDMQQRLDESEANALKGGKKAMGSTNSIRIKWNTRREYFHFFRLCG